ncbi:MAG: hypothetical protein IJE25_00060 [Clostridia bacterium]|nr:hypothetical protein [Clostridia bacterium]
MNKIYYTYGNPFKVKFREHYCYICGEKLMIVKHRKIVDQKSEEAKYYDFNAGDGAIMGGSCEFIHKVFFCPQCSQNIEFITQINKEDIDIIIKRVQKHFQKKGRNITISKCFENHNEEIVEKCAIELIKNLCLVIEENGKSTLVYKIPLTRKGYWERPYYFKISKRKLIKYLGQ